MTQTPYYEMVPKDFYTNLLFRKEILRLGYESRKRAEELWIMCARDILFYINTFVWTYDPRGGNGLKKLPFITYPKQDEIILEINNAIGNEDIRIEKSRDTGASWMCLTVFDHRWRFYEAESLLMISRNEDYVDKSGNPKCLFWKLDFLADHLPGWLKPSQHRIKLHLQNLDNGSVIDGESTTGDVARGDRRNAILLDEYAAFEVNDGYRAEAATIAATPCRILNSTPQGVGNAYADSRDLDMKCTRIHWSDIPDRRRGIYGTQPNGKLKLLDREYWRKYALDRGLEYSPDGLAGLERTVEPHYKFVLDGKIRSPWYDLQCRRTRLDTLIAQELDIDFLGSGSRFFSAEVLRSHKEEYCRPPYRVGELHYDSEKFEPVDFVDEPRGHFKLWINVDVAGKVPADRDYVAGADISAGTGASNSVLSILDKKTGGKVGEFVHSRLRPEEFADYCVSICRWFKGTGGDGAYLIWEANGPGNQFGARVVQVGFRNIYFREKEDSLSKKSTDVPGWWATPPAKQTLFGQYGLALSTGAFMNRSKPAIEECELIVFGTDGKVVHTHSVNTMDSSGARENHADRVTADALAWRAAHMIGRIVSEKEPEHSPYCFAARREAYEASLKSKDYW